MEHTPLNINITADLPLENNESGIDIFSSIFQLTTHLGTGCLRPTMEKDERLEKNQFAKDRLLKWIKRLTLWGEEDFGEDILWKILSIAATRYEDMPVSDTLDTYPMDHVLSEVCRLIQQNCDEVCWMTVCYLIKAFVYGVMIGHKHVNFSENDITDTISIMEERENVLNMYLIASQFASESDYLTPQASRELSALLQEAGDTGKSEEELKSENEQYQKLETEMLTKLYSMQLHLDKTDEEYKCELIDALYCMGNDAVTRCQQMFPNVGYLNSEFSTYIDAVQEFHDSFISQGVGDKTDDWKELIDENLVEPDLYQRMEILLKGCEKKSEIAYNKIMDDFFLFADAPTFNEDINLAEELDRLISII